MFISTVLAMWMLNEFYGAKPLKCHVVFCIHNSQIAFYIPCSTFFPSYSLSSYPPNPLSLTLFLSLRFYASI